MVYIEVVILNNFFVNLFIIYLTYAVTNKKFKKLTNENLRDNMSNMELILTMLAEASTTEISKAQNPVGLQKSKEVARKGGSVAKSAREDLERETGQPVITSQNAKDLKKLE